MLHVVTASDTHKMQLVFIRVNDDMLFLLGLGHHGNGLWSCGRRTVMNHVLMMMYD